MRAHSNVAILFVAVFVNPFPSELNAHSGTLNANVFNKS